MFGVIEKHYFYIKGWIAKCLIDLYFLRIFVYVHIGNSDQFFGGSETIVFND